MVLAGTLLLVAGPVRASAPPAQGLAAPQDLSADALFGYAVAASVDRIAVAAPHASVGGAAKAGAVFLFDRATLSLVRTFEAPDPVEDAVFGYAIALRGDRLLVGAPRRGGGGAALAGAAYLFDAASGRLLRRLTETPPRKNGELGSAVALDGADAIVGAPGNAVLGREHAGVVHRFDGATGAVRGSFHLPEPEEGMVLGQSLALAGPAVLIGAPNAVAAGARRAGAVFVFDASSGRLLRSLRSDEPQAGSQLGFALAGDGAVAVVGAPNASTGGRDRAGAAYVFDLATGSPTHRLHADLALEGGELFGYSVALLDDAVLVGAPHATVGGTALAGAVYVFDRKTGNLVVRLDDPAPSTASDFGVAVAGAGDAVVVGAQRAPTAQGRGAAYVFAGLRGGAR